MLYFRKITDERVNMVISAILLVLTNVGFVGTHRLLFKLEDATIDEGLYSKAATNLKLVIGITFAITAIICYTSVNTVISSKLQTGDLSPEATLSVFTATIAGVAILMIIAFMAGFMYRNKHRAV